MQRTAAAAKTSAGLALVCAMTGMLAYCRPWTVRPIDGPTSETDETGRTGSANARGRGFDAAAYVDAIWESKVLPATASAMDVGAALAAASSPDRRALLVAGTGVVTRVDERSRVGVAYVDLVPTDGRPDVTLQVGPVLRGTAVRDALAFVRFADFANQVDFARVANALNARVLQAVIAPVGKASALTGRTLGFTGAVVLGGGSGAEGAGDGVTGAGRVEIVPVVLHVQEPGR